MAIPSSRLYLSIQTLGVAFEFVGNYASVDFHHRALICPSYEKYPEGISNLQGITAAQFSVKDIMENGE